MDRYTAAAIGQNLGTLADAFLDMNNPEKQARARLIGLSAEEQRLRNAGLTLANQQSPETHRANLALLGARTATEGAQQGYYGAQTQKASSEAAISNLRLGAGRELMGEGVPFTTYSTGAGGDEMTDRWTEKGYTATGKNLTDGVVAVDPSVYPLGTIFQSDADGNVFIAADTHGNSDPNVVDIYRAPGTYSAESGLAALRVIGREKIPYGASAEQLHAMRDRYARLSNVFGGGGADDLARATARNVALSAGGDEQVARNAATAISGNLPGQGEYSTPEQAAAFQQRAIAGDLDKQRIAEQGGLQTALEVEAMRQQGDNQRKLAEIFYGGRNGSRSSSSNGADGVSGVSLIKPMHEMIGSRFGMADDDGNVIVSPELRPAAGAWQTTFANLVDSGLSPAKAEVIADQHHNVGAVGLQDPWFGAPRMEAGKGFNFTPLTPEDAMQFAPAFAPNGAGTPDLGRIFGMAPVQGPQLPPQPVPQTGAQEPAKKESPEYGGRRLGEAMSQKAAATQRARDQLYNSETLQMLMPAIQKSGLSIDDVLASALSGDANDAVQLRLALDRTGLPYRQSIETIRNALLDGDVIQGFGIDPRAVSYYASRSKPQAAPVRRFNPATGRIE